MATVHTQAQDEAHLQDDFQLCLDYINSYNEIPVPTRSPKRPSAATCNLSLSPLKSTTSSYNDVSSDEFALYSSDRNLLFSGASPDALPVLNDASFYNEIALDDEICVVDKVVTILKYHDQWDPRKVAFVSV